MIIYIDKNHKCHVSEISDSFKADIQFFDGKCKTFIEGYCCIPEGETCVISDTEYTGLMVWPWENYGKLEMAQLRYENDILNTEKAELEKSYREGVNSI